MPKTVARPSPVPLPRWLVLKNGSPSKTYLRRRSLISNSAQPSALAAGRRVRPFTLLTGGLLVGVQRRQSFQYAKHATIAIAVSPSDTTAKVTGSCGVTRNSTVEISGIDARARSRRSQSRVRKARMEAGRARACRRLSVGGIVRNRSRTVASWDCFDPGRSPHTSRGPHPSDQPQVV